MFWTGDLGLAIFLLDCIEGGDRLPTLDVFHQGSGVAITWPPVR